MVEKNGILANPAPLGLLGFGMTTVLLNLHNAGYYGLGPMILAMGIFYGGIAQIVAGILEFKKGNTFGVVAFTSYGLFWLSLVGLLMIPAIVPGFTESGKVGMASYFFMWGLFTFCMFIGTLKKNTGLQFIFGSLFILFFLLALENWGYISGNWIGYEGIFCGFTAFYVAIAEILNETYGKTMLPLGRPIVK
jgi:succinate-acetate transporter protein